MSFFFFVEDMAAASVYVMNLDQSTYGVHTKPMLSHINVGVGHDLTIAELAELISEIVGYQGAVDFDRSKPDGSPQKLMDNSRIEGLGWRAKVELEEGLRLTYHDFVNSLD